IYKQPSDPPEAGRRGCDVESCAPAEFIGEKWSQGYGNHPADLIGHIHEPGERAGRLAAQVRGNGPESALRKIKRARPTREDQARHSRILCRRAEDYENRSQHKPQNSHAAATQTRTEPFCERIAYGSAKRTADGHRQKRQSCVVCAGFQIQSANLGEIEIKPTEENPSDITKAEVGQRENPHIAARQYARPGDKAAALWGSCIENTLLDECEFVGRDRRMRFGCIARRDEPDSTDGKADQRAHQERGAPAVMQHEKENKRRCDAGADADTSKNKSVGLAALIPRNPPGHKLVGGRIDNCFPRAKQKPEHQERHHDIRNSVRDARRKRAEHTPPHNSCGENATWPEAIRKPAGRSLKQRVSQEECAEDEAQLLIANREFFGKLRASDGKIDPVEVGDCAQDKKPEDQEPTHARSAPRTHPRVQNLLPRWKESPQQPEVRDCHKV